MDYGLAAIITTLMICITPIILKFIPNKKTTTVETINTSINKELFEERFKNLGEKLADYSEAIQEHIRVDEAFQRDIWKELNEVKTRLFGRGAN